MDNIVINHLAVLTAALSTFLVGGLWYAPFLFGKSWMKENGFSEENQQKGAVKIMISAFILQLIMCYNLAAFLSGPPDAAWGAMAGLLAGFGWVALAMGVTYLFERKSLKLFFINAGYHTVSFTLMGLIIGAWK